MALSRSPLAAATAGPGNGASHAAAARNRPGRRRFRFILRSYPLSPAESAAAATAREERVERTIAAITAVAAISAVVGRRPIEGSDAGGMGAVGDKPARTANADCGIPRTVDEQGSARRAIRKARRCMMPRRLAGDTGRQSVICSFSARAGDAAVRIARIADKVGALVAAIRRRRRAATGWRRAGRRAADALHVIFVGHAAFGAGLAFAWVVRIENDVRPA